MVEMKRRRMEKRLEEVGLNPRAVCEVITFSCRERINFVIYFFTYTYTQINRAFSHIFHAGISIFENGAVVEKPNHLGEMPKV